ncbi:uncharacterized protein BJ212DRAFT_1302911 [Suillus subaureus]|uniref:F-box domain-containing protein n=1 Tax=Suillus subaureus TaxID=48587 RepID=A0A9P7E1R5_9AGAM|nr:uncharacterized protein BJ212DRAFT_1302911 [Suillus subaureus]KAG1808632.1 hypothetical protein BJ212DRAFT_1302911 [Suillus subaureus]
MRVVRSRRNRRLPISRLPTEILVMIFKHFEEEKRFDGSASDDVPACLPLTHVCKDWRTIALQCPALWTSIHSSSPRWLGIMFERSQNLPLVVTYKSPVSLPDCLELVLSHLPRIKVLRFRSFQPDCDRIIQLLSSQPAPLLEIFDFSKPLEMWPETTHMTGTIFQGQAPRLRSVELTSFDLSWSAHIFSGLQTLSVRGTKEISFPTLPQLLSVLGRMPALEHLTLERLLIIPEGTKLLEKVPLARLKSITLGSPTIRTAISLFAQLAFPVDAKIALSLRDVQGLQDISDLFSAMGMHPGGSSSIIRSMRAFRHTLRSFCVQFSTSTAMNHTNCWNPDDDDIRLSLQFMYHYNIITNPDPSTIFDIRQMVTQDRIQTLFLSKFDLTGKDFWGAGSVCLPDLEVMHMKGIWVEDLIDALKITKGDIPYPSLRVLDLEDGCFLTGYEGEHEETLQDVMKTRAERGVGIHTLRLVESRELLADQVQGFREVVATVDWDEFVEPDDDEDEAGSINSEEVRLENEARENRVWWFDDPDMDRRQV